MAIKNSANGYGWLAQWLHWCIAALIITQFILAQLAERAEEHDAKLAQLALLANHKSVGITILMLAVLRVGWRAVSPPPRLPAALPRWQIRASRISHLSLYVLIFALPLTGWLMSSASAYTVSWFNLFELPDLVGPDKPLKKFFLQTHHLLAEALFVLALLHIAAALKHHFIDKDVILRRMSSASSLSLFGVLLVVTLWSLATVGTTSKAASGSNEETLRATAAIQNVTPPAATAGTGQRESQQDLPAWNIDYTASSIQFTAIQAGAKFTGRWPSWRATIKFDRDAPARSIFDVQIDVTKVDSQDAERDATLMEAEWFATQKYPKVTFVARKFKTNPDGSFTAAALLGIKGNAMPVDFDFTVTRSAQRQVLEGSARLDRLALQLGTGDWSDLEWVGQYVDVNVHVEAAE